ncbi:hypothetical protein ACS0TY_028807 [Phlomoides rotata]
MDQKARDVSSMELLSRNSCKLTIKVVQFIFRLQIEGQSCGRDDTEFYRFNKNALSLLLRFQIKRLLQL